MTPITLAPVSSYETAALATELSDSVIRRAAVRAGDLTVAYRASSTAAPSPSPSSLDSTLSDGWRAGHPERQRGREAPTEALVPRLKPEGSSPRRASCWTTWSNPSPDT